MHGLPHTLLYGVQLDVLGEYLRDSDMQGGLSWS